MSEILHWVKAGTTADIEARGMTVVSGERHTICVVARRENGELRLNAVDNRCPHMGFPLSRGTVCDGILTCHWHHARFDLASGGTFDPFADDVAIHDVRVVDGDVWVDPHPRPVADRVGRWLGRLEDGLEQDLSLVIVKSVLGLLADDDSATNRMVERGGLFGARQRAAGWGPGLTILTAMGNVLPLLEPEERAIALFHGLSHVASDCAGQPTRFGLDPLASEGIPRERIVRWFRQFIEVRNADGAERALLTALAAGAEPAEVRRMMIAAATDHFFINGGHTLDFVNKGFELLELIGWQHAPTVLPSLVRGLANAVRSEEQNAWRSPIDLVALVRPSLARLPSIVRLDVAGWSGFDALVDDVLAEDPSTVVAALDGAFATGATPAEVAQALSYASALRVARFPTSNEFGDWVTVLHTFTYLNALHQSLKAAPSVEGARGLYHGALRIYLDRFLNVPAARAPDGRAQAPADLAASLTELLDRQQQVAAAADLVDAHLRAGGAGRELFAALGTVLLREDAEFHTYQTYEAGARLFAELAPTRPEHARHVAVAVARYLAAHAPTHREMRQTARIAIRLQRGDDLTAPEEE